MVTDLHPTIANRHSSSIRAIKMFVDQMFVDQMFVDQMFVDHFWRAKLTGPFLVSTSGSFLASAEDQGQGDSRKQ